MEGSRFAAIAVMRLESRPPLRKDATGTSATMCAATDSSRTAARSAGGPAAAASASSAGSQ